MSEQSIAFDRAVEYYDETRGFPPEEVEHIGKFVGDQLPPQAQVLEVGVGTGRIALPVAPYAAAYYGLDLSLPMMARLRSKQQTGHIFLAQGDATRLPYPDDYFDAAITVHIFHLIPGWQTALAELARVLKPEGQLFNCWGDSEPHPKGNSDLERLRSGGPGPAAQTARCGF